MESKKLEALLMAVDLGSFTKAAEVLGYTQSGLTHMMNSLEREVGFPLLDRGRHGVKLTREGEKVAPAIREFLKANAVLDSMIAQVGSTREETIRVGAYASIAMHWLPDILYQFRSECENVNVDIRMADDVDSPYELLQRGELDAIFVSRQKPGPYDWIHLADDRLYAVLPKDYPTENNRTFAVEEYEGKEFIMPSRGFDRDILRIFEKAGVHPDIHPTMVDDSIVVSMVGRGLGVSMMTELTLRGRYDKIKALPVKPAGSRELGMAVRSLRGAPPWLVKFIDCAERVVPILQENSEQ